MHSVFFSIFLPLLFSISLATDSEITKPCTITSPFDGAYYDLNTITVQPPIDHKKAHKDDRSDSWHARGHDYNVNFTMNFCAPVIEPLSDVVGVDSSLHKNISAFYQFDGKTYSIGQESSKPVFRGRKLVLNYTSGSPCDSPRTQNVDLRLSDGDQRKRNGDDDDDDNDKMKHDDEEDHDDKNRKNDKRLKSTIISFHCENDSLKPKVALSFVAASEDECTYFFEVRSIAACGGVNQTEQSLGPGGVFGVIALIAAAVYLFGGIAYQRTVMHQRGWRQLPNYSIWAGIGGFIYDILITLTSTCARFLPHRRGYNQLPSINHRSSRSTRAEDENRLIDQLDEEWDD